MAHTNILPADGSRDTLWKTLQTFNVTRVVIALVLFFYFTLNNRKGFWTQENFHYKEICFLYLVCVALFAILAIYYKRRLLLQIVIQVAIDIGFVSILYISAGGMKSGLAILYLFPLAGGAILAPLVAALFMVSLATLVLLAESIYRLLSAMDEAPISQAGLYGAAFFAAALVINRLAVRLINQEKLAVERGRDLRVQLAINHLVIADMGDGILVVDDEARIVTINPAAARMLELPDEEVHIGKKIKHIPHLLPIAKEFASWAKCQEYSASPQENAGIFVVIKPARALTLQGSTTVHKGSRRDLAVHLRLQFANVDAEGMQLDRTIIFLQDVSEIENQAQQLKLASMGRLTASIAHEVRNPLSAISYANGLLGEEVAEPAQKRLVKIIGENVVRLNRMVEDILKLSRKAQVQGEPLEIFPLLIDMVEEFRETHAVRKGVIQVSGKKAYRVWFDPMHLREVVVNLLSNAVRYASGKDSSIQLEFVENGADRLELHVKDDGPAITPEVRAHLFEPFYTTSSKGTGLGLYLARELCLNNGAMLDYEYQADASGDVGHAATGRFVITFSMAAAH
ncbi:ATP-binding protein [Oxalobacteraceae bacterium R-40]|uniref:histidine kinase n=1 Tax=Keguizhuia sedimenti TaxID=3064264 RepID=A0ABU1BTJ8_9BURK|nr:ATP-binding protein [Oxalobacteraceae bacterium R-40]